MKRYVATITDKAGRILAVSAARPSREEAAAEVFAVRSAAKQCSTCRARPDGGLSHMDIRWHTRTAA